MSHELCKKCKMQKFLKKCNCISHAKKYHKNAELCKCMSLDTLSCATNLAHISDVRDSETNLLILETFEDYSPPNFEPPRNEEEPTIDGIVSDIN